MLSALQTKRRTGRRRRRREVTERRPETTSGDEGGFGKPGPLGEPGFRKDWDRSLHEFLSFGRSRVDEGGKALYCLLRRDRGRVRLGKKRGDDLASKSQRAAVTAVGVG